jgi:hypothetical protein
VSRAYAYVGRLQGVRGNFLGLPGWARFVLLIAATPGLVLLALSAVIFIVSLFALFLLAAPVYGMLRNLLRKTESGEQEVAEQNERRQVTIRVLDPDQAGEAEVK